MFGDGALDGEGDVVGEGLGVGVENSDVFFAQREDESPESKPAGDMVEDSLDLAKIGLPRSGGSTGDGDADCRVILKLWDWRNSREGDGKVIDIDDEVKEAEDSSLGYSVGHWEGGSGSL